MISMGVVSASESSDLTDDATYQSDSLDFNLDDDSGYDEDLDDDSDFDWDDYEDYGDDDSDNEYNYDFIYPILSRGGSYASNTDSDNYNENGILSDYALKTSGIVYNNADASLSTEEDNDNTFGIYDYVIVDDGNNIFKPYATAYNSAVNTQFNTNLLTLILSFIINIFVLI